MNNFDVLVIGRSCLDVIAVVNQFPKENQKLPLEFRLTEGGGQGGTASCCISRLGGRVAYVGKLGDDEEGKFCLQRIMDFGVSPEFIDIVAGGKTPVAYVFITADSGARSIIYERNSLPKLEIDSKIKRAAQAGEPASTAAPTRLAPRIRDRFLTSCSPIRRNRSAPAASPSCC